MVVSMSNTYMKLYLPFVSSMNLPQVGALFAARRRLLGISESGLAALCDLSVVLVRRLESGQYVPSPSQTTGQFVLVYDDVCTTGTQLDAVAGCLLDQGQAARVEAVVLARALWRGAGS